MDVHSQKQRSFNMSRIKGKNTKPELAVRSFLHRRGFRFRLHQKNLPGKPDIVLAKYKTVIFVNGCFWHQHEGCPNAMVPETHRQWWLEKFKKNKERDKYTIQKLESLGWQVLVIWECQVKTGEYKQIIEKMMTNKS